MSAMGQNIEQFDIPVCNSFKAKILNDQLCYEVDLDSFKNFENVENQIKLGFGFIMDYNEDRQTIFSQEKRQSILYKEGLLVSGMLETDDNLHAVINLNTIGMYTRYVIQLLFSKYFNNLLEPVDLIGEGVYNLNVMKEIRVTNSYLGLDVNVRGCQDIDTLDNCTTRHYEEHLLNTCGCLPFDINPEVKV